MSEATHKRIFVYGTLMRGNGNNRLIESGGGWFLDRARIVGYGMATWTGHVPYVFKVGWPGIVYGELFVIPVATVLRNIDTLEGHPHSYMRTPVVAIGSHNELWTAEAYLVPMERIEDARMIPHGDFRKVKPFPPQAAMRIG